MEPDGKIRSMKRKIERGNRWNMEDKRTFDLLTLGQLLLRLSPPGNERLVRGDTFEKQVGGAELNVAVGVALGVVAVAMAAIFSYSCGSSYMMASQLAWNTVALPLGYLGGAMASGTALWYVLCAVRREEAQALSFAALETLVGSVAALVTALVYGAASGVMGGDASVLFWLGVVICGGVAPLACAVTGLKKTEGALPLAVVAAAGALIGSVAYRVLMWTASVALMSLFGVGI